MINFFRKLNRSLARRSTTQGFTLVETLIAISIFTMSVVIVMTVLSQGISDTGYAKKKLLAAYLAQEGVEYIRNMRDTFMLYDSNGWSEFKNELVNINLCGNENGCYFDSTGLDYDDDEQPMARLVVDPCDGGDCPPLLYDASTGKYDYNPSGVDSGFVRKIQVEEISADEVKVFSTVSWTQGSGPYEITLSEVLFNWLE